MARALTPACLQMGRDVSRRGPLGKLTLPTVLWDKLDSTPCGHHAAPDGSIVLKPVDERLAELQRSRVLFDHYTYPCGNEVHPPLLVLLLDMTCATRLVGSPLLRYDMRKCLMTSCAARALSQTV